MTGGGLLLHPGPPPVTSMEELVPLVYDVDATACNVPGIYQKTTDPTVTDDAEHGFRIADQWLNEATLVFWQCTDPSPGAACWRARYVASPDQRVKPPRQEQPPLLPFRSE